MQVRCNNNRSVPGRRVRAFTLIEAVLALALMIMLLAGVYGFYATTIRARDVGSRIAADALSAHGLLDRMADEIRHTTDMVPGDGQGFSGTHDKLVIMRASMPDNSAFDKHDSKRDKLPPAQMDIRRISYELVWDDELTDDDGVKLCHGLLRSEQTTFDPNPKFIMKTAEEDAPPVDGENKDEDKNEPGPKIIPVEHELVAPDIKYVRFEYFDGAEWQDRWQAQQGETDASTGDLDHALPQAVRITLGHDRVAPEDEERILKEKDTQTKKEFHADRFTLVVYLFQADQSMLSSRKYGIKNNTSLETGGGS